MQSGCMSPPALKLRRGSLRLRSAPAKAGGAEGIRTPDPHNAIVVLYQLSYDPSLRSREINVDWLVVKSFPATAVNQYVARPPDRSKTAPVLNEHSSDASHAASAAASSVRPNRPMGIFESM